MRSVRPGVRRTPIPSWNPTAMKAALLTLAFGLCLSASATDTIELPKTNAVISAEVPDYWEPKESGEGVLAESPGRVGMIYLKLIDSNTPMITIIEEVIQKLARDDDVIVDTLTQEKRNFEERGRKWNRVSWTGSSREWGPTVIGLLSTEVAGYGKRLVITYWLSKKDSEQSLKSLGKVFASVRPAN
jgi:hypothetical protein